MSYWRASTPQVAAPAPLAGLPSWVNGRNAIIAVVIYYAWDFLGAEVRRRRT